MSFEIKKNRKAKQSKAAIEACKGLKAYQLRGRSRCWGCLLRVDISSRWCSQYRLTTVQCHRMNQLYCWWGILYSSSRRCIGIHLCSRCCRLCFHSFQLCNKMVRWMKIFASLSKTFAFDIIDTDSNKTICVKRTMCLRMCKRTCFGCIQALTMLKIGTYLERKRQQGENKLYQREGSQHRIE